MYHQRVIVSASKNIHCLAAVIYTQRSTLASNVYAYNMTNMTFMYSNWARFKCIIGNRHCIHINYNVDVVFVDTHSNTDNSAVIKTSKIAISLYIYCLPTQFTGFSSHLTFIKRTVTLLKHFLLFFFLQTYIGLRHFNLHLPLDFGQNLVYSICIRINTNNLNSIEFKFNASIWIAVSFLRNPFKP